VTILNQALKIVWMKNSKIYRAMKIKVFFLFFLAPCFLFAQVVSLSDSMETSIQRLRKKNIYLDSCRSRIIWVDSVSYRKYICNNTEWKGAADTNYCQSKLIRKIGVFERLFFFIKNVRKEGYEYSAPLSSKLNEKITPDAYELSFNVFLPSLIDTIHSATLSGLFFKIDNTIYNGIKENVKSEDFNFVNPLNIVHSIDTNTSKENLTAVLINTNKKSNFSSQLISFIPILSGKTYYYVVYVKNDTDNQRYWIIEAKEGFFLAEGNGMFKISKDKKKNPFFIAYPTRSRK